MQEAMGADGNGGDDGMGGGGRSGNSDGNSQVMGRGTVTEKLPIANGNLYNRLE